ncbi:cation:dicarboxylate symporter family transporter [Caballeronia sp. LZ032]|uniref:dicarboxylate/amino acid:cation symporter n=1 Tax=Caballeronia sp. LZ032 TaxID=3038565 RepID=UPI00285AC9A2|nr:cation:dicarboxylase symporter family transporter [Caballeronia sp. LZ032]MDR5880064.1 cation:dicarboxylase symporter family transporter [Caballeronia sp. LZ032]
MKALHTLSQSTLGLIVCIAVGALCGVFAEPAGAAAYFVGQMYLAVVNMAAIPLLVVATFFGLRQVIALPRPRTRIGMMLLVAFGLVVLGSVAGTLIGVMAGPGQDLSATARAQLGRLVLQSASSAEDVQVALFDHGAAAAAGASFVGVGDIFPDNFYRVLAQGHSLGIFTATILFGLAFAALSREQTGTLSSVFEGVYRALETIIARANLLLPVLAFGVAAHLVANTEAATLHAMSSFLVCFGLASCALGGLALVTIAVRAGQPFMQVLSQLKAPLLVGLTSGSATAPIPHTIEALSQRLGFSRGVVELVVPFGSVFVRAGAALYYALAAVFVANLYNRPLGAGEILIVCAASVIAALVSAGQGGVASVGYMGIVLSMLNLPVEAAGVLFVTLDLICEGPRNALSLLSACMVIALVSAGLPSERHAAVEATGGVARLDTTLRFTFTRGQLALATGCLMTVASLIVLLGIGVGAR